MKAIVQAQYGSPEVLQLKDVEKPTPLANQVLVNVRASSLNKGNVVLLRGKPFLVRLAFGLTKPKFTVPGGDVAGVIEAIGKDVQKFKVGDEVFADLSASGWGAFAEYVSVPENEVVVKPANLSFEEAAAVPMAGLTALQGLKKGNIKRGDKVLINGASGGVGTFAVQIAKAYGAFVTAICSTRNVDLVHSLGADEVIDYTGEDITDHEEQYDLIIAVNGYYPLSVYKRALRPNGRYVMIGGSDNQLNKAMLFALFAPLHSMAGKKKMTNLMQKASQADLEELRKLIEVEKVKPIIDASYKLSDIQNAFHYLEEGHAMGKVVISV
ncbi:NAD(P)-dependent alcohol dehydrogenase [Oceanobacillus sp. CF4.6]|uniref:NAD(P)-dependent alcohol dehydrogenase n=1 Tax=Oceanobacillus sp. CF4.6 TaxID=3373080 RepID=UPI003EE5EFD6